jgi:excisionase family DNA binding protein
MSDLVRALLEEIATDPDALTRLRELVAVDRPNDDRWIGVREAAAHLGCKPQRIYDLVNQGRIPHAREGSRLLFRQRELDQWLRRS